jgi:hypothetical protein
MLFFKKLKATIYRNKAAGHETATLRKRRKDQEILLHRLRKPVEAHPEQRERWAVDKWDFVRPGQSAGEQEVVAKISSFFKEKEKHLNGGDDSDYEAFIHAGFSDAAPATYGHFIAT